MVRPHAEQSVPFISDPALLTPLGSGAEEEPPRPGVYHCLYTSRVFLRLRCSARPGSRAENRAATRSVLSLQ